MFKNAEIISTVPFTFPIEKISISCIVYYPSDAIIHIIIGAIEADERSVKYRP